MSPAAGRLLDEAGWYRRAARRKSPNCDDRPPGVRISLLVVHGISLPPGRFGGDAVERLIAGAKKEGVLTIYSSVTTDDMRVLVAAFEKKYGVKMQFWRASSTSSGCLVSS